ncbi:hypothetical protein BMS3Bbin14_01136 [bacterium BMS3Bbin14]|nr:hypothetical protein BMS3Abin13_01808 [bacterium BMS3Abin13]GBE52661.1 hypothetical protein BMS3Bbin14_01136 [bacterium BMS3Bbin14]
MKKRAGEYVREFKKEAVELITEQGGRLPRRLGISG